MEPTLGPHKNDSELVYNITVVGDRNKIVLVLPTHQIFISNSALESYSVGTLNTMIAVLEAYIELRMPVRQLPYLPMLGTMLSSGQGVLSIN